MATKLPPEPCYFLDENMEGAALAARLTEAGLGCVRISRAGAPFHRDMADEEWIPLVAARGWWGVTRDGATLKNPVERRAIESSLAVHIVLRGHSMTLADMAAALIKAHNRLRVMVPKLARPAIIDVTRAGEVRPRDRQRRGGVER